MDLLMIKKEEEKEVCITLSMVSSLSGGSDAHGLNGSKTLLSIQRSDATVIKSKYYTTLLMYLAKSLILYLLIGIVQIGTATLQYILLYTNTTCTIYHINPASYHIECISLFCLTLLPFIFVLLLRTTVYICTVKFIVYLFILIIFWCSLFVSSIHGYITWRDHISCTNDTWYQILKILFIIWFSEQILVTISILCYHKGELVVKLSMYLLVTCIQLIACIMQLILIFDDHCTVIHIISYKIECICILILYTGALLAMISRLEFKIKVSIVGVLWFALFGLSIHSYTVWDDHISCSNNKYRIIMIVLFIIWLSEQIIVMMAAALHLLRETIKQRPQVVMIGCGVFCVFCGLIALPIISSLLQVFYLVNKSCNGIDSATAISLFTITILMFLLLICLLVFIKHDIDNLTRSDYIMNYVAIAMCIVLLWFTQFALAYTSLNHLTDVTCSCKGQRDIFHGLFLSWVIIYGILCVVCVIGGIILFVQIGTEKITVIVVALCQLVVSVVATVLQLILITSGECEGELISVTETAFLIIFLIFQCCLLMALQTEQSIRNIVVCLESILFVVVYVFVIKSMSGWSDDDVHCGEKEPMKTAAFILFLVWMIQYTLYIVVAMIGGLIMWRREE